LRASGAQIKGEIHALVATAYRRLALSALITRAAFGITTELALLPESPRSEPSGCRHHRVHAINGRAPRLPFGHPKEYATALLGKQQEKRKQDRMATRIPLFVLSLRALGEEEQSPKRK
jgi:hypothetical protein